ncbi:hypothetical protein NDU88_006385 [Pleurodeles waltl]|uniref:Uncharacterized protein n=1 Tax=Pleurodeles waltl TaxID=8319 RepID=A0AAV7NZ66_PLEWA|nr:hypothetical protein NDU88_006385 [Pleurodeles waltl]
MSLAARPLVCCGDSLPTTVFQCMQARLLTALAECYQPAVRQAAVLVAGQFPEELVDTFYARLVELASKYTLHDVEDEIQAQFIKGCHSVKLQEDILQVQGMSMANMLTLWRSKELLKACTAHIEAALVNGVTASNSDKKKSYLKLSMETRACYMCEGVYPHQGQCPALGKRCTNCIKLNHLAKVCQSAAYKKATRTKTVHGAQLHTLDDGEGDMDDDDLEGAIHGIHAMQPGGSPRKSIPKCNIQVEGSPVVAIIDTWASISILALPMLKVLQIQLLLHPTTPKVFAFGSATPLPLARVFWTHITHESQTVGTIVYITKTGAGMLLSCGGPGSCVSYPLHSLYIRRLLMR